MFNVDNSMYDPEYQDLQDTQQAQVAACRAFYTDEEPLPIVEDDEVVVRTEVRVTDENLGELAGWLRQATTWLSFHPAVVEDERGLVVVF